MKTPRVFIGLAILGGSLVAAAAWSQQTPAAGDAAQPPALSAPAAAGPGADPLMPPGALIDAYGAPAISKVEQALRRVREADELHKPALVKELESAISTEFDEDMKHRDAELAKLEERVAKLRAQFERRKKAKAEITQLQTKVLVNEIDGLGFTSPWANGFDELRSTNQEEPLAPYGPPAGSLQLGPPNVYGAPRATPPSYGGAGGMLDIPK